MYPQIGYLAMAMAGRRATEEPDPVAFIEVAESKPVTSASLAIKDAEAAVKAAPMKVRVNAPHRVVHNGKAYTGGQTLSVPNDEIHSRWLDAGWVTKVKGR